MGVKSPETETYVLDQIQPGWKPPAIRTCNGAESGLLSDCLQAVLSPLNSPSICEADVEDTAVFIVSC